MFGWFKRKNRKQINVVCTTIERPDPTEIYWEALCNNDKAYKAALKRAKELVKEAEDFPSVREGKSEAITSAGGALGHEMWISERDTVFKNSSYPIRQILVDAVGQIAFRKLGQRLVDKVVYGVA